MWIPLCTVWTLLFTGLSAVAADQPDYSDAERLIFMSDQLKSMHPPATLRYAFKKSGSSEPGFDDVATIHLTRRADGHCCDSKGEFLSGARRVDLPEVGGGKGNPVILYFLERDIHDMHRLTKGQANHFRRYIRMAIYKGAVVHEVSLAYKGHAVKGQEISFAPYLEDPNRPKYDKLAKKQYVFRLSDAVPGGVYGIRAVVTGFDAASPPLLSDELVLDGATSSWNLDDQKH